jgi:transposase
MAVLADRVDGVIGVDTHRDTLTAAAVTAVGGLLGELVVTADAAGYQRLLDFARARVPGRRCFAVEGAGSYGAGLTRLLVERGEWVIEVDRPKRPARRGGKSDALDAIRAAREVLTQERLAAPRRRGDREALRVLLATRQGAVTARTGTINQLKALIVGAPEELRAELRRQSTSGQVGYCAALRDRPTRSLEHRMTVWALRFTALRIQVLTAEASQLEGQIGRWWVRWRRGCWSCPEWGRSAPPRCWSAGRMPGGCTRRRRLLPSPVWHRSRPPLGRSPGIG